MKTIRLLSVLLLTGTFSLSAQKSEIKLDQSFVKWTGDKFTGSHYGDIVIKSGYLELKNGDIVGGKVVMDMSTITVSDIKDEESNQKLVNHLKSDDFFGVEKYPTSTFQVSKATKFNNGKATVTGVLTIKGKSDNITFDVFRIDNKYYTRLDVDRSKYDVRFGSNSFFDNLGDKAIDNIFILHIQIVL